MNYFPLSDRQLDWQESTRELAEQVVGPRSAGYDRDGQFPQESLDSLREAGPWALRVSEEYGGLGADLLTACLVVEEISKKCPSTAMCYKMHLEASEILNLLPTPYQIERFVKPMAEGKVFSTIAGGESGGRTGNDWQADGLNVTSIKSENGNFKLDDIRKSYVTSAGHATHYTMFCRVEGLYREGPPNLLVVEADQVDWEVLNQS